MTRGNSITTGNFDSREMLEMWVYDLRTMRVSNKISFKRIADICGISRYNAQSIYYKQRDKALNQKYDQATSYD